MVWYNKGKAVVLAGASGTDGVDLWGDTVHVALMDETFVQNINDAGSGSQNFFNDVEGANGEVGLGTPPTNYSAGGQALATPAININDTADRAEMDWADEVFSSLGGAANGTFDFITIFVNTAGAFSTDPLIAGVAVTSTLTDGGDVTLVWDATGVLHLT